MGRLLFKALFRLALCGVESKRLSFLGLGVGGNAGMAEVLVDLFRWSSQKVVCGETSFRHFLTSARRPTTSPAQYFFGVFFDFRAI